MTIKDKEGFVPLHYAARHEFLEIVTLLVDNHADIDPIKYVIKRNKFTQCIVHALHAGGCYYSKFMYVCVCVYVCVCACKQVG